MISIGDTLIIEPIHGEKKVDQYKSRVLGMEEKSLYIEYPIHLETNKLIFLMNGAQLRVNFVTNEGIAYLFHSEVIGRKKDNNVPVLILSLPSIDQMIKIQRRQFVRIETSIDMAIHPMEVENSFQPFTTVSLDFSAGGAAVIVPKKIYLEENSKIKVSLVLPLQNGEYNYLHLDAEIKKIIDYNENSNKMSIEFLDIEPVDRQSMLRFSFDRQLSLKKKGLEI
ncbi:flagellar brake protein [Niallia sp. Sow4_A1]|uniref:Flagellar brake domain-containing protein n=1 Tax=Niallia hominis TaxID=3133173 RepID=A0ABV1EV27_9BACI|nr:MULTISPECIES: flagellar brake domain-containing protein [Bacillaceae]MCM3361809.1 flagellar brake domain-containing protein [Niallia sp. MER TA 168]